MAKVPLIAVVAALAGVALSSAPVPAGQYAGTLSMVPNDVDVYDQPGGEGKPRAEFLKAQSKVYLQGENDHWCNVAGDSVPGGPGWIWCGMGNGQNYKLTPVTDNAPAPTEPTEPTETTGGGAGGGGTGQ